MERLALSAHSFLIITYQTIGHTLITHVIFIIGILRAFGIALIIKEKVFRSRGVTRCAGNLIEFAS